MITCDKDSPSNDGLSNTLVHRLIDFGERLKEERVRLKLTQAELGAVAAVAKNTQHNYEKGLRVPDAAYLAAVAAAGVDVLYVVTGQRTPVEQGALSMREQKVLYTFRGLPEDDQKHIERVSTALKESPAKYDTGSDGSGSD